MLIIIFLCHFIIDDIKFDIMRTKMSLNINKYGGQEIMIQNLFLWTLINSEHLVHILHVLACLRVVVFMNNHRKSIYVIDKIFQYMKEYIVDVISF